MYFRLTNTSKGSTVRKKSLTYKDKTLDLYVNDKNEFFFDDENIQNIFNLTSDKLRQIIEINTNRLNNPKEFFFDADNKRFWSKLGIIKLGFFTQHDDNLGFIDFLENLKFEQPLAVQEARLSNQNLSQIYKTLEEKFVDFSKKIEGQKEEDVDMDELKKFIETFNLFVQTKSEIFPNEKAPLPSDLFAQFGGKKAHKKSSMLSKLFNLPAQVEQSAFKFAQGTRENAFDFAQDTRSDAFTFTQDTRDDAYNFASNTSNLAFDFAMKTEDDAYKFASQLASDAYHFASDGMNYGYMFASQGEELGPMANRVLWMASQIGLMADRIGEMSDRIVHTEHLIMNMSVMILNFGLLIDGTIKTLTEAGLAAIGMVFDKESIPKLESSSQHIDLIGKNVELILKQQHEYDLKVLENQVELREVTNRALDKIKLEY